MNEDPKPPALNSVNPSSSNNPTNPNNNPLQSVPLKRVGRLPPPKSKKGGRRRIKKTLKKRRTHKKRN